MAAAIVTHGISKNYRTGWLGPVKAALQGVDLTVRHGSIFGILGPNGAGKTTLISILTTLLRPDSGWARVLDLDVVTQAAVLRQHINLAASNAHFLWCLTTEENLRFAGRLYGIGRRALSARIEELLELFDLKSHRHIRFEHLSTGLKQRLALAKALINSPRLLFLDEPTTGLDPLMAQHIREQIARLNREEGLTILLTTHNLREAEMLCDEVAFLKEGCLAATGSIHDLQARLGLGDRLTLIFPGAPAPLDYSRLPGVLAHAVSDSRVELVLDQAESRTAAILAAVQAASREMPAVKVKPADLEELYREITH